MSKGLSPQDAEETARRLRQKAGANPASGTPVFLSTEPSSAEAPYAAMTEPDWHNLHQQVGDIQARARVWTTQTRTDHYPALLRPFAALAGKIVLFLGQVITKPQQDFNLATGRNLEALRVALQTVQHNVQTMAGHSHGERELFDQIQRQQLLLEKHLEYIETKLDRLYDASLDKRLVQLEGRIESTIHRTGQLENRADRADDRLSGAEGRLSRTDERLAGMDGRISAHGERFTGIEAKIESTAERIADLSMPATALSDLRSRLDGMQDRLFRLLTRVAEQERRMGAVLEEARKRLPDEKIDAEGLERLANEAKGMDDALYLAFEDVFRGSREEIKERLCVYLPVIEQAGAGSKEHPVLDVGCGRGEWLELLKERTLTGCGIDTNLRMVDHCTALGLDVREGDVLEVLRALRDESLGAITGFHLIEHLPPEVWIAVFDEALRVLQPGGVVIFETPNPENVSVGSNSFYIDPTHRHPLPPPLVQFVAEERGFGKVEIRYLHPVSPDHHVQEQSETAQRFNTVFYGPRDYAVIAWKG